MSRAETDHTVTDDDTAEAVGSGSLPVLGTPRLLAWMEAATCLAVEPALGEGSTSVGTRVELTHGAPSAVGRRVRVEAVTAHVDGRLHRFEVSARHLEDAGGDPDGDPDGDPVPGAVVATAQITRVVVRIDRFTARL